MISTLIDGLISLALGIWMLLLGFKVVTISSNTEKSIVWHQKWGLFMKIAGPLVALWGAYNFVRAL
jgi:hypothetical protein